MELREFEILCESTFHSLFTKAKEKDRVKFLTSCLALYQDEKSGLKIISYMGDYEFDELLTLIKDFFDFDKK